MFKISIFTSIKLSVYINEGNFKQFYEVQEEIGFREFGKVLLVKHKITEVPRVLKSKSRRVTSSYPQEFHTYREEKNNLFGI